MITNNSDGSYQITAGRLSADELKSLRDEINRILTASVSRSITRQSRIDGSTPTHTVRGRISN